MTSILINHGFAIDEVDPRLYGGFVEHLHRCVYTGIYEPGHPAADESGLRGDVADLVRELGVEIVRYPGGNFVSGYQWEDGVGPRQARPTVLDLAWGAVESNAFGTDEFMQWCRLVGVQPMLAVNLGTRGASAASNLVEYCNAPTGSRWADLRAANASPTPHDVRVWCLGNEMDGPWQIGRKTAEEYGRLAAETAKAMRRVDPRIELVACGSSNPMMPTFGGWERTVLEHTYEFVDYLSLHSYYEEKPGDRASFLASAVDMDNFIEAVTATADHVRATRRHRKTMRLSFDEWNVWFPGRAEGSGPEEAGVSDETYTVADAVVVGNLLISLLRHADRVAMACLAQLVNVLAPIRTAPAGPSWRQTIYFPFALTSRHGRGTVLQTIVDGPVYPTEVHGEVPVIDAVGVWNEPEGELAVFAVNRDQTDPQPVEVQLRGLPHPTSASGVVIAADDPDLANTAAEPDRVRPRPLRSIALEGETVSAVLPPLSWTMLQVH